jgi:hypothetical protein
MKAITLHEPWAWLMAAGWKQIETRSWPTSHRGPLAIHAGLHHDTDGKILHLRLNSIRGCPAIAPKWEELPFGCIIATCQLVDCQPTEKLRNVLEMGKDEWALEIKFGNFKPGRFAWFVRDITWVDPWIPARGYQGLWNWKIPPNLAADTGLHL